MRAVAHGDPGLNLNWVMSLSHSHLTYFPVNPVLSCKKKKGKKAQNKIKYFKMVMTHNCN